MSRAVAAARAVPALLRASLAEAVAYRAELLVWVLSTTMPLIMLALWSAVARDGAVGRFGQAEFTAYFLATFIVRQLTGSWIAWQMSFEVRHGTLAMRLLRPIHPMLTYAVAVFAALPMRLVVVAPVAAIAFAVVGTDPLPRDPALWAVWLAAMIGAWLITFFVNFSIGCLAFFLESAVRVMDLWLVLFFVASGYLIPVELFPPGMRGVVEWLPFRFLLGFPVEVMTSAWSRGEALSLLLAQWLWVGAFFAGAVALWRTGLRRFAAFGG